MRATVTTTTQDRISFQPTPDEAVRHSFVTALKQFVNFTVEGELQRLFSDKLTPDHIAQKGRPPENREEAAALLEPHPLYQLWASLTFHSQNLMWETVGRTTERILDDQMAVARRLTDNPDKLGTLTLSETLKAPAPISTVEIHRQPGGYTRERQPGDITQGLTYMGSASLYRRGKRMGAGGGTGSDEMGQFMSRVAKRRAPDLDPRTILDMGCGIGEQTLAYKRAFPEAEVTGIDCSRPFVRFAHALAEGEGLALNFAHMDAGDVAFADESFDMIVSIIMFHETSAAQVHQILKECWRLLKPGGLVLHLDVPYQPHRTSLTKQVTNHWQVRNNGEPFWTGFGALDMKAELVRAGFDESTAFCDYEALGKGSYLVFGGRKP